MREVARWTSLAVAAAGALMAAVSAPVEAADASVRYSAFFVEDETYQGVQATIGGRGRLSVVGDAAAYFGDGGGFWVASAGPRVSLRRGEHTSVFLQLLAGVAGAEDGAVLLAQPGLGADFRRNNGLGLRVQVDWPIITAEGVYTSAPRLSAGVVFGGR